MEPMGKIERAIELDAPIEMCYRVLTSFERFPEFLKPVHHVRQKGDPNVWHWEVKGRQNKTLAWEMEVDALKHRNNIISWHTVRNADVAHSGAITLERINGNRTCLTLVIQFTPAAQTMTEWGEEISEQKVGQVIEQCLSSFQEAVKKGTHEGVTTAPKRPLETPQRQVEIAPEDIPYSI